jgi:RNA polymerase-interacting CarD/CdnL/TRCF family regulator
MFEIGDAVVHPKLGAGIVVGFTQLQRDGQDKQYYDIELASKSGGNLMVPIENADANGLRPAVSKLRLKQVWRVLCDNPSELPKDYKERQELIDEKLQTGSILAIAEAIRDMAWRQQEKKKLTSKGKRTLEKGILLLAAEVATVQGTDLSEAKEQIQTRLQRDLLPKMGV